MAPAGELCNVDGTCVDAKNDEIFKLTSKVRGQRAARLSRACVFCPHPCRATMVPRVRADCRMTVHGVHACVVLWLPIRVRASAPMLRLQWSNPLPALSPTLRCLWDAGRVPQAANTTHTGHQPRQRCRRCLPLNLPLNLDPTSCPP